MIEDFVLVLGAILILGPFVAWLACSKTGAHKDEPPDIVGAVLAFLNPVLIGFVSLAFAQGNARWLGALIVIGLQIFLWRRVVSGTNCGARMSRMVSKVRVLIGIQKFQSE